MKKTRKQHEEQLKRDVQTCVLAAAGRKCRYDSEVSAARALSNHYDTIADDIIRFLRNHYSIRSKK